MTTILTATPTKLGSTWGATVTGNAAIGDTITITTQAGQSWNDEVTGVVRKIEHIYHGTQTVVRVAGRKPASSRTARKSTRRQKSATRRRRVYCDDCDWVVVDSRCDYGGYHTLARFGGR